MRKILGMIALTILATSSAAIAEDKSNGCGLGWQVTNKTSFLATTTRSTTNLVAPPTFGMTSGTMGCAQHSIAKRDEDAAKFFVANYEPLLQDMAAGRGEYLEGFARTMGCNDSAQSEFGTLMRKSFSTVIEQDRTKPSQIFELIRGQIRSDASLASKCRA